MMTDDDDNDDVVMIEKIFFWVKYEEHFRDFCKVFILGFKIFSRNLEQATEKLLC
jgi:hypothetical protein